MGANPKTHLQDRIQAAAVTGEHFRTAAPGTSHQWRKHIHSPFRGCPFEILTCGLPV